MAKMPEFKIGMHVEDCDNCEVMKALRALRQAREREVRLAWFRATSWFAMLVALAILYAAQEGLI